MIPVLDLRPALAEIREEIDAATERVHAGGGYILGAEVEAFEREFAEYCRARHGIGVASGLDAIQLVLRADGIGPGDEVIVPAYTAVATWMGVSLVGATPVGVDCEPGGYNIDPGAVEVAVTEHTRAILPVHVFGQPAAIEALEAIARRHDLRLYEDAAQAHGAEYAGGRVGSLARAATFSFYPVKNLGAFGDGGAITTDDDALTERVRLLRTYGWRRRGESEIKGMNSRLDEIQSAWLRVKLRRLDDWNQRRRAIAQTYLGGLEDVNGLQLPPAGDGSAWHLFVIGADDRDAVAARLRERGVGTLVHYDPLPHLTSAYRADGWKEGDLPVAERLAKRALSLPMFPQLADDAVERVIDAVKASVR